MQGSLALARGTLFVGVHAKTARVRSFDLGGTERAPSFAFRDPVAGRSAAAGLAVDDDHTLLVADTPADRVRRFSLFGREVGGLGGAASGSGSGAHALPGLVNRPVDVEVRGNHDHGWIAVACAGEQRHAVQLFEPDFSLRASLAAFGDAGRAFRDVRRLASAGELVYVAEARGRCVQVFRSGQFLFAFQLADRSGEPCEPSALAPVGDGRLVVGCRAPRSALFLVDGAGRPLRCLAGEGTREGEVLDPTDAVLEPGAHDRHARLFVIDHDGLRVQVFTLEGRCLGAISLAGSLAGSPRGRDAARASREEKGGR